MVTYLKPGHFDDESKQFPDETQPVSASTSSGVTIRNEGLPVATVSDVNFTGDAIESVVEGPTGRVTVRVATGSGTSYRLPLSSTAPYLWGEGIYGQIGDAGSVNRPTPVQLTSLTTIVQVACGGWHTLFLLSDGTVMAAGLNEYGELGDGTTTQRDTPVAVSGLTGVVEVAAGHGSSYARKSDGTVWAWGFNEYGQLGQADGLLTDSHVPVQVVGVTTATAIAAGVEHLLILLADTTVRAVGLNQSGELGDGTITDSDAVVTVKDAAGAHPTLTGVVAIGAGPASEMSYAIVGSSRTAYAWGFNNRGQQGDGGTGDVTRAKAISAFTGVRKIIGGGEHTLILKSNGAVYGSGSNSSGELGDGSTLDRHGFVAMSGVSTGVDIGAGIYFSMVALGDGTVVGCGDNTYGMLGLGTTGSSPVSSVGAVHVVASVKRVSCGWYHSAAWGPTGSFTTVTAGGSIAVIASDLSTLLSNIAVLKVDVDDFVVTSAGDGMALLTSATKAAWFEDHRDDVTGSATAFTLSHTPSPSRSVQAILDGVVLGPGDFTVSGAVVTFGTAPPLRDNGTKPNLFFHYTYKGA